MLEIWKGLFLVIGNLYSFCLNFGVVVLKYSVCLVNMMLFGFELFSFGLMFVSRLIEVDSGLFFFLIKIWNSFLLI